MRLAGYDWVPETRSTRSRGVPGEEAELARPENARRLDGSVLPPTSTERGGFRGFCSVTAYMNYFPDNKQLELPLQFLEIKTYFVIRGIVSWLMSF